MRVCSAIEQREGRQARKAGIEQQVIDKFQTILGLKVEPVEDQSLQFTFTCIDKGDPEAEFRVMVVSTDAKRFEGKLQNYVLLFFM